LFKRCLILLSVALYVLGLGKSACACTCSGGLFFDDNVKHSSLVLLGRVKAQGRQELLTSIRPEVVYIDVEVVEVYRGTPVRPMVRIWDPDVGTNCGGGLDELAPGKLLGLVMHENKSPYSMPGLWEVAGILPGATDYLIGACSEYWKAFKTQRGARRYMKRLVHEPVLSRYPMLDGIDRPTPALHRTATALCGAFAAR
jgi:hypothetical protein